VGLTSHLQNSLLQTIHTLASTFKIHIRMSLLLSRIFLTRLLLKETNATILSLVPKKPNPTTMGDYRPIACCNVLYKCNTKILSNRMLPILDSLINRNQSAFLPGRSISEKCYVGSRISQKLPQDGRESKVHYGD
jgi:hypothetical protein